MFSRSMTENVQQIIKDHLFLKEEKDLLAVDATMGNGFDLEFLSLIPQIKTIWGFDVQEQAVNSSKEKVKNTHKEIHFIQDSHHKIDEYIRQPIDVAIFNLGYLPQGDKTIVTITETTLIAIGKVIEMLSDSGILTIMTYPGHEEGEREHRLVEKYLSGFSQKKIKVIKVAMVNVNKPCPNIFVVIK